MTAFHCIGFLFGCVCCVQLLNYELGCVAVDSQTDIDWGWDNLMYISCELYI